MAVLSEPPRAEGFAQGGENGTTTILTPIANLEPVVGSAVEAAGFRLVRLRVLAGKAKTLQVMAERPDGHMSIEDCAALSRALSDFLEREDPFDGEYVLEVSSPGIDRPLTRITDFARWAGHEAKLELAAPDSTGRRRFKGMLLGLDGNDIVIDIDGTRTRFGFRAIAEAKLVLTDRLIQEDLRARKKSA